METLRARINYDSAWTPESFCSTFHFRAVDRGFTKEINGKQYLFKRVNSPEDLSAVQNIQKNAWDWKDVEIVPVHVLSLWDDTGGGVFSAFGEDGEMVGFAAGMGGGTDRLTGKPTIISSMLAMNGAAFRSGGIGKELKIIQAYYASRQGYEVMKWFYDPERGENASLNLRKLGARAEEFAINKYGEMKSGLYGVTVPTDRFRAVWRFTRPDVINRVLGFTKPPSLTDIKNVELATPSHMPSSDQVRVEVSSDIDALDDINEKIRIRLDQRKIFSHYFFDKNYVASEFVTGMEQSGRKSYYLLEPANRG